MAATPSGCYILPKERKVIAPRLLLLQARRSIFNSATAAPVSRLTRKSRPCGRDLAALLLCCLPALRGPALRFSLSAVPAECQADRPSQAAGRTVRSLACSFPYHLP